MRRFLVTAAAAAALAAPVEAQLNGGMPLWNSPKGGGGIMIAGDYGMPSDDAGGGTAFGAHATFGFSKLTLGVGLSSYEPDGASSSTSYAGLLAFRLIGGSLNPVNVNIFGGAGTTADIDAGLGTDDLATMVAGAGVSVNLPVPGIGIEPYLNVSNRWTTYASNTESDIGWTLGANVTFGMFGAHVAYDSQDFGGTTRGVLGIGAHVSFGVPGM